MRQLKSPSAWPIVAAMLLVTACGSDSATGGVPGAGTVAETRSSPLPSQTVAAATTAPPTQVLTIQRQVITEEPWGIPTGDGYVAGDAWDSNPPRTLPAGSCYGTGFGSGNALRVQDESGNVLALEQFDDLGKPAQIAPSDYDYLFDQFHGTSVFGDSSGDIWVCVWEVSVALEKASSYKIFINPSEGYGADQSVMGWVNPWDEGSPCNWTNLPGPSCYAGYEADLTWEELDATGWLIQICDEPENSPADFQCVRSGGE